MSHFTVLVIGNNVDEQLAPYHEFECTGHNDEYIQNVDITEECRDTYLKNTTNYLVSPLGEKFDAYDERFYRKPTAEEKAKDPFARNVREIYPGWTELTVPTSTVKSFAEFVEDYYDKASIGPEGVIDIEGEHKYGYTLLNEAGEVEKVIRRTNSNAQWDWYSVGGRWTGMLKLKPGKIGSTGRPGLMTEAAKEGTADQAIKGDIDWEGMRTDAGTKAAALWDKVNNVAPNKWESWDSVLKRIGSGKIDEARNFYHSQPGRVAIRADQDLIWVEDDVLIPRDEYIQAARDKACSTYAVVVDSKWIGKGKMGWFGMSDDKEDSVTWAKKVTELIDSLSDDTLLTIVDCHI